MDLKGTDLSFLLVSALRYAMGRASTAPSSTDGLIRKCWPEIPEGQRDVIIRDLSEELARAEDKWTTLGHQCDHDMWSRLLAWCRAHHDDLVEP